MCSDFEVKRGNQNRQAFKYEYKQNFMTVYQLKNKIEFLGAAALPGKRRFYRVLNDYFWCDSRGSLHRYLFLSSMGRQGKRKLKDLVNEVETAIAHIKVPQSMINQL